MDVVVVGSINQDVSVRAPRLPRPGETLIGSGHFFGPGGKGANQAVAAARLGASTAMVGRVGRDSFGVGLVDNLSQAGVDVSGVGVDDEAATGVAVITIDDSAENSIVGSLGANLSLAPEHLDAELIAGAKVVLAQLEIPIETVATAARLTQGTFILVPAPAQPLPQGLTDNVDILVPNRGERDVLADAMPIGNAMVVTLGAEGALVVEAGNTTEIPAFSVDAVDTTGAGDAFAGALAVALSQGQALTDAARFASAAGALAATRLGAQTALPTADEIDALLAR